MRGFVSKVPNGRGGTAVRVEWKRGRQRVALEHVGTGHTDQEVALLAAEAWSRVNAGQEPLWADLAEAPALGQARTSRTYSGLLWDALDGVWRRLGFDLAVPDRAFKALSLARVVEPTSKTDSARVLADLGQWAPSDRTVHRCIARCQDRGYRKALADACWERAGRTATLLLYDVTTLYFESDKGDEFRVSGFSKERRLEPQIVVGLLVDQAGFPLDVRAFKGNTAETKTILPVVSRFAAERGLGHVTVVADAAMLAEANLLALEDAGFFFIVGSRIDKVPWKVAEFARAHPGEPVADGRMFVEPHVAGTKRSGLRRWSVVYQYRQARAERDLRNLDKQVAKARAVVAGLRPVKRAQFVVLEDDTATLNEKLIAQTRARAGIKGYITNLPVQGSAPAPAGSDYAPPQDRAPVDPLVVVSHYHQLFEVEASFRISKADIKARPMWVRARRSVEAHLTMVFAGLAVSRAIQQATGVSIRRFTRTLRPVRTSEIAIGRTTMTIPPVIPPEAAELIESLTTAQNGGVT